MIDTIAKDKLRDYVKKNEVVFQAWGNLVELANEVEKDNKKKLLAYFDDASSVEVYTKGHCFIQDEFSELDRWATEDDMLFLLQNIGVLICVPKKEHHNFVNIN